MKYANGYCKDTLKYAILYENILSTIKYANDNCKDMLQYARMYENIR